MRDLVQQLEPLHILDVANTRKEFSILTFFGKK